ncbi:hypothetical protein PybrP1_000221 [[Pythium] brassicae (nom. inval.)]|nr:hypothetical protein PybrP1_000221 [[Pythium] brassicae (nom. inval.)]
MLGKPPAQSEQRAGYIWRMKVQGQYEPTHGFELGDAVWMYMARVKPELSKKLAYPRNDQFSIVERDEDFGRKLKTPNADYRFYP